MVVRRQFRKLLSRLGGTVGSNPTLSAEFPYRKNFEVVASKTFDIWAHFIRPYSSTDRVPVSETVDVGSIPTGGTLGSTSFALLRISYLSTYRGTKVAFRVY